MGAIIIGIAATVGSALIGLFVAAISQTLGFGKDRYWYDFINFYVKFPPEYTKVIDSIMSDPEHGEIRVGKFVNHGVMIPDIGYHKYYIYPKSEIRMFNFGKKASHVGIEKILSMDTEQKYEYYRINIWFTYWGYESLKIFTEKIKQIKENSVQTISIDLSEMNPQTMTIEKISQPPNANQKQSVKFILDNWHQKTFYNQKVMISGPRGVGKSYTAQILKKQIDQMDHHPFCLLFDDFDPSSIGVNIKKIALSKASKETPVILVINEVDISYQNAISEDQCFDPREQHTRNKQTFNKLEN